ncbi:hypothetical protein B484DRAFT_402118, partial [Ochromonadaceae sp. CCMP2298]
QDNLLVQVLTVSKLSSSAFYAREATLAPALPIFSLCSTSSSTAFFPRVMLVLGTNDQATLDVQDERHILMLLYFTADAAAGIEAQQPAPGTRDNFLLYASNLADYTIDKICFCLHMLTHWAMLDYFYCLSSTANSPQLAELISFATPLLNLVSSASAYAYSMHLLQLPASSLLHRSRC